MLTLMEEFEKTCDDQIFQQYLAYLTKREEETNNGIIGRLKDIKRILGSGDWGYVNNPNGGFYGYWGELGKNPYNKQKKDHRAYYQIKLTANNSIPKTSNVTLEIRINCENINNQEDPRKLREKAFNFFTENYSFLSKPSRFRSGKTMAVAQRSYETPLEEAHELNKDMELFKDIRLILNDRV